VYTVAVREQIQAELDQAEGARAQGLEGRARVSARRAAGLAIQAYLEQMGGPLSRISAYDLIKLLGSQPDLSQEILQVTEHLTARVDGGFNLPFQADLIEETRWLISQLELLAENKKPQGD
jgi:hypothetical protein